MSNPDNQTKSILETTEIIMEGGSLNTATLLLNDRTNQIGEIVHNTIHAVAGHPMAFGLLIAMPGGRVLCITNVVQRTDMINLLEHYLAELKEAGPEIIPATPDQMPK